MGKTNSPLTIWVWEDWRFNPAIRDLVDKGHTIYSVGEIFREDNMTPNLILHPVAWRWNDKMWPFLEQALRQARAMKKIADKK